MEFLFNISCQDFTSFVPARTTKLDTSLLDSESNFSLISETPFQEGTLQKLLFYGC